MINIFKKIKTYLKKKKKNQDIFKKEEKKSTNIDNSGIGSIILKNKDWFKETSRESEEYGIKYIEIKRYEIFQIRNNINIERFKSIDITNKDYIIR